MIQKLNVLNYFNTFSRQWFQEMLWQRLCMLSCSTFSLWLVSNLFQDIMRWYDTSLVFFITTDYKQCHAERKN